MLRNKIRLYVLSNNALKRTVETLETDTSFNGDRPVTREGIPNINVGGVKLKEFIENYFFPPVPAVLFLDPAASDAREVGDLSPVRLHWSVTKKTQGIVKIIVAGIDLAPAYPDNTINTDAAVFNHTNSGIKEVPFYFSANVFVYTYYLYATDTLNNIFSASCPLYVRFRRIWFTGYADLMGLGASATSAIINEQSTGFELASGRIMTKVLECHNEYLYLLWPLAWGGIPNNFKMNGKIVNAWASKDFNYTNPFGFTYPCRMFRSQYRLFASYQVEVTGQDLLP